MVEGMKVNLIYDGFYGGWFWQLKTEKVANGPFDAKQEAMADAIEHYEGAKLIFTEIRQNELETDNG